VSSRRVSGRRAEEGPESSSAPGHGPAAREVSTTSVLDTLGGGRGLLDSAIPATVFVLARVITDSLTTAIAVALLCGLGLVGLRVRRGEPLTQVWSGFFGLVIAVLVARATGTGEGFFLPGILITAGWGVGFVVSLLIGRPAVGLALAAIDPRYAAWQQHAGLLRACRLSTAFWALTFFVRSGVAWYVYQLDGDSDGLLLIVVNAVKWPLIAAAALLTMVLVKRSGFVAGPKRTASPPAGS